MKLTKESLKRIIKEELEAVMSEGPFDGMRFDTSRKQDVGSYGWDTPGEEKKKNTSRQREAVKSRQEISHKANQKALAELEQMEMEANAKNLAKHGVRIILDWLNNDWEFWQESVAAWENSKKDDAAFHLTILKALNMITPRFIENRVKQIGGHKYKTNIIKNAAIKAVKEWDAQMEEEYKSQIGTGKRSFMKKAGSFLTGKGFKEE